MKKYHPANKASASAELMTTRLVSISTFTGACLCTCLRALPAVSEPRPEEIVEVGDRLDLLHHRFHVVRDADELDVGVGDDYETAARIAVARLADGADVDD